MRTVKVVVLCLAALMVLSAVCLAAARAPRRGASPNWWGPAPNPTPTVQGVVVNTAPDQITLNLPRGPQAFAVTPKTEIFVAGQSATMADIKLGDPCILRLQVMPQGLPIALRINVPKPRATGMIDAITGNVLTVRDKDVIWHVTVPDGAKIVCRTYQGTLADLQIGYHVGVSGQFNGTDVVADVVEFMPFMLKGVVTAVDGNQITVATTEQTIVTGVLSDKTMVLVRPRVGDNRPGTPSDIKVESPVDIGGSMSEGGPYQGGTMQLLLVDVLVGK